MLGATLPSYGASKENSKKAQKDVIDASDPKNRQKVKDFFNSID